MKNKKHHTVQMIQKPNINIVDRGIINIT